MVGPQDHVLGQAELHLPQVNSDLAIRVLLATTRQKCLTGAEEDGPLVGIAAEVRDVSPVDAEYLEANNVWLVVVIALELFVKGRVVHQGRGEVAPSENTTGLIVLSFSLAISLDPTRAFAVIWVGVGKCLIKPPKNLINCILIIFFHVYFGVGFRRNQELGRFLSLCFASQP